MTHHRNRVCFADVDLFGEDEVSPPPLNDDDDDDLDTCVHGVGFDEACDDCEDEDDE